MAPRTPDRARKLRATGRRLALSTATVAATGALTAFATLGAFTDDEDPFPHSVVGPVGSSGQGPG